MLLIWWPLISYAFLFMCETRPTPRVHWKRIDGGPVDDDRMVHDKHEWIINNVQREDAGTYECSGENGGNGLTREVIKKEFTLEVECKYFSHDWLKL